MKRLLVMTIAALTAVSVTATAQSGKRTRSGEPQERPTAEQMAEMRTERMTKSLSLTEEQQKEVYKLNLEHSKKMRSEMEKNDKSREEAMKSRQVEREKYNADLKKALTAEQYASLEQQRGKRSEFNRGGEGNRSAMAKRSGRPRQHMHNGQRDPEMRGQRVGKDCKCSGTCANAPAGDDKK